MTTLPVRITSRDHIPDQQASNDDEGGALYRPSRKAGLGSSRTQSHRNWEREEQAWNASTGSVTARNQALLQRTRFVREGRSSRPWSGKLSDPTGKDDEAEDEPAEEEEIVPTPEVTVREEVVPQQSMAELYSQLAVKMSAPPISLDDTAAIPTATDLPSKPLPPPTITCPTCSSNLPNPCSTAILRQHLSSLVHRMSLSDPKPSTRTTSVKKRAEDPMEKLYLDSKNKGYILLQDMGWTQGIGLGLDEWEYLQQRDRETRLRDEERKKEEEEEEAIVISSSSDDDSPSAKRTKRCEREDRGDMFAPVSQSKRQQTRIIPASQSASSTSAVPTATERKARLVPVTATYKNDKRGLGIKPLPNRKRRISKNTSTSSQNKRQRSEQQRRDRDELESIRQSLR